MFSFSYSAISCTFSSKSCLAPPSRSRYGPFCIRSTKSALGPTCCNRGGVISISQDVYHYALAFETSTLLICSSKSAVLMILYGAPFSHLFTELKISPIEVHISAIQLQISSNRLNCRYLQMNCRYLQMNCRYLQMNCRYLQFN